jgi:membrane protein implicated in regulation of membrane protease activity
MAGWVLWLIVACVLGFGEALTGRAFLMPWAIGAALAAIVDVAAVGGFVPWLVFVIGSALARPLVAVLGRSRSRREVSRPIRPEPMVANRGSCASR